LQGTGWGGCGQFFQKGCIGQPDIANDNGIADAWEKMFGITDPHGDGDGNLDEYLAGTDPLAPNSKPVASDLTSVRLAIRNPDASATPGTWFDPVSWIRITDPLEISVSERIYHYPAASAGRQRFFRLHQQP